MRAGLLDLDGVLTQTAKVHAVAWKEMFDTFPEDQERQPRESFVAFDQTADYDLPGLPSPAGRPLSASSNSLATSATSA